MYASTVLTHLSSIDCSRINRLIKRCHRIICQNFLKIEFLIQKKNNHNLFEKIVKNNCHALYKYIPAFLPSGRLNQIVAKTNRRLNCFVPHCVSDFNKSFQR